MRGSSHLRVSSHLRGSSRLRGSLHLRLAAALASILVLGAVGGPVAEAATVTPLNKNLVKNASFEAGSASVDGYQHVKIPRWKREEGSAQVVKYGTPGYPSMAKSNAFGGGTQFLFLGHDVDIGPFDVCDSVTGNIPIRGRNYQIDSGHILMQAQAWAATSSSENDTATFHIVFYDGGGNYIGTTSTEKTSHTAGNFNVLNLFATLPAGTRRMRVILEQESSQGDTCDVFFDKIRVILQKSS